MKPSLADKTLNFWRISMAYNQRAEGPDVTTSDAISLLNSLEANVGPQRALATRVFELQDKIIIGRPKTQQAAN